MCQPAWLLDYAEAFVQESAAGPLFENAESERARRTMKKCIEDLVPPVALRNPSDPWWIKTKASDEFLDRLFEAFFEKLGLPNLMLLKHNIKYMYKA